jgi:Cu/Ag efflux protein CusF
MSPTFKTLFMVAFSTLVGCSAYEPEPLTTKHPAHPDAATAPNRFVSKTLDYAASDKPTASTIMTAETAKQSGHDTHHEATPSAMKTAVGEGKVIAVVPNNNQLVLEHGPIQSFMDAMTMGYSIESSSLLEGLKAGDRVRFTIDVEKKTIVKIEKLS